MSDDRTKKGWQDRSRINIHERYELEYWAREFGITTDRLKELVGKYGTEVSKIRSVLGK
jgi:hypothetical protein